MNVTNLYRSCANVLWLLTRLKKMSEALNRFIYDHVSNQKTFYVKTVAGIGAKMGTLVWIYRTTNSLHFCDGCVNSYNSQRSINVSIRDNI